MTLIVTPQYGPGARREWAIYAQGGEPGVGSREPVRIFGGYARSWTGAHRAVAEIKASLARLDYWIERFAPAGGSLTQEFIDTRPRGERPMGALRLLVWKAARN